MDLAASEAPKFRHRPCLGQASGVWSSGRGGGKTASAQRTRAERGLPHFCGGCRGLPWVTPIWQAFLRVALCGCEFEFGTLWWTSEVGGGGGGLLPTTFEVKITAKQADKARRVVFTWAARSQKETSDNAELPTGSPTRRLPPKTLGLALTIHPGPPLAPLWLLGIHEKV